MKKQLVLMVFLSLLSIEWLSGCNSSEQTNQPEQSPDELLIGGWSTIWGGYQYNFTFYTNHTYSIDVHDNISWMNYDIVGGKFTSIDFSGAPINADFIFSDNNQTLTLTAQDNETLVLTRK